MSEAISEVVRARRIEMIDEHGVVRAVLGTVPGERAAVAVFALFGPGGSEHVTLYRDDERGGMQLTEGGNEVASFSSSRDGDASLAFHDPLTQEPVQVAGNDDDWLLSTATSTRRGKSVWSVRRWVPAAE